SMVRKIIPRHLHKPSLKWSPNKLRYCRCSFRIKFSSSLNSMDAKVNNSWQRTVIAGTHPPIFSKVEDPLEADSWLRLMEAKFELLTCTEEQKTVFATHQLRGPAASWWETYLTTQPVRYRVPWTELKTAFKTNHVA